MTEEDSYRKLFVAESIENHENIVKNLLILEEGADEEAIAEIFRSAHTLKGMSASMGFTEMEHLCHSMEDVFHSIRNGSLVVTPDLTDLLLACTDRIEQMLDDVESGGDTSLIPSHDLVEKLKRMSEKDSDSPVVEESSSSGPAPAGYEIHVSVDPESSLKDIRALLVLQNLRSLGEIIDSCPSFETLEGDNNSFDGEMTVTITTDADQQAIQNAVMVTEILDASISAISGHESPNNGIMDYSEDSAPSSGSAGMPRYNICIKVSNDCGMKDVRALIAIQNLEELGEVISAKPTVNQIDNGEFEGVVDLIIVSDAGPEALESASCGPDIEEVIITPAEEANIPTLPASSEINKQKQNAPSIEEVKSKTREVKNIRVDITRLDQMMNLVEDLVINGGRLKQIAHEYQAKEMDEALNMVSRSISDLQNLMMYIRMIPLNQIFNRFPRVVRDVAHHDGKDVDFIINGGETELDRSVMDGLGDPLLHLIRNGVNHGIEIPEERVRAGKPEKGTLKLSAWRDQGNVIIELSEDGGGINIEKVREKAIDKGLTPREGAEHLTDDEVIGFLFQPGFSTAETITDISGRGVGLDVVKSAIESLKGSIHVESVYGKGTTFRLTLPPTMAIVEVMMVRINKRRCAIPITAVVEVASANLENITHIGTSEAILLRDEVLQIHRLDELFGGRSEGEILVIVQYHGSKCCIPVDIVEGQQEVVVKPLSKVIGNCRGVGGVTIPGDGDVVPILDVNTMI